MRPSFPRTSETVLASLFVATPYQGRGIGRRLMAEVELGAVRLGYDQLHLYTWTAESFYRRLGWITVEPAGFPESVLMQKEVGR